MADLGRSGGNGHRFPDGLAQGTEREVILASLTGHFANKLEGLGEALTMSLGGNDRFIDFPVVARGIVLTTVL